MFSIKVFVIFFVFGGVFVFVVFVVVDSDIVVVFDDIVYVWVC